MKIRNGFVSNSSTCSFVICGFLVPKRDGKNDYKKVLEKLFGVTEEDVKNKMLKSNFYKDKIDDERQVKEFYNEMFYDYTENSEIGIIHGEGAPEDGIVIGRSIVHGGSDDFYLEETEYDFEELMKEVTPLREKMECTDIPIKLYTGTLNC